MRSRKTSYAATSQKEQRSNIAPGKPGDVGTWAPGAKLGVGTALSHASSVWFTIARGVLTEIFHPSVDSACTRDMQFYVTDRSDFLSAASNDTYPKIEYLADGVPAFRLTNTCKKGRYSIVSEIVADPRRSV